MKLPFLMSLTAMTLMFQPKPCDMPKIVVNRSAYEGCNHGNPKHTKKYADNSQKSKRNRPYYGHRNHKYIIPKKNRV